MALARKNSKAKTSLIDTRLVLKLGKRSSQNGLLGKKGSKPFLPKLNEALHSSYNAKFIGEGCDWLAKISTHEQPFDWLIFC